MINTFYDAYTILNKVYSEKAYLSQAISSTSIEEINRRHTIKLCYGVLDKDIELSYCISKLVDKNPKLVIRTLLKLAFYSIRYLNKAAYSVTDNIVELSKKLGKGANAGFLNAVIRRFNTTEIPYPTEILKNLSVKYSYPEYAVKMLFDNFDEATAINIMAYDEENQYIRFNSNFDGEKYLTERKIEYKKTVYSDLFNVKGVRLNDDFYKGVFTFQAIGSRAICEAVGKGNLLLDACSAPGGKAVFLSDKFNSVVACELYPHRAELIKSYAERFNKSNIEISVCDSMLTNSDYIDKFDSVLCDVPCSGFGTIKDNPDIKLKGAEIFDGLNKVQFAILSNCSLYVKSGGKLIYSTCSIFNRENDAIINKFLKVNQDFEKIGFDCSLPAQNTEYGKLFLPHLSGGAGFYVCVLKRKI